MLYVFQGTGIGSGMSSSIPQTIRRRIGGLLSPILARLIQFTLAHPTLKTRALDCIFRYPVLEEWLYRFAVEGGLVTRCMTVRAYSDPSKLTPNARIIYNNLKSAIELHDKRD